MNGLPVRLLQLLRDGGIHSTAEMARRLDISEGLLGLMVADLVSRGYLLPVNESCHTGCDACGLVATCHVPSGPRPALLALAEKGRRAAAGAA